jgi:tRNA wybutosine-synthesizing protein 3
MFSSGNITEKARVGKLAVKGETIVDLYAGIGYFVLPYLLNGKAAMVHACEWNPHSIEALRRNLIRNGVADRCKVYPGDNAVSSQLLLGVADRVNLGLIPTSEAGWPCAVDVLKPTGGWMHVHDNVHQDEKNAWVVRLEATLTALLNERKPASSELLEWRVHVEHVEKVKSYAPRVYHYVADVRCALEPVGRESRDGQQAGACLS